MPPISSIYRLSPETVHKIAAGEVIERPANVVKELVENALDAQARKITVTLEDGGLDLIKVADNGIGMVKADARLAWLPHTTSKIREAGDLDRIATYGFRGEALCSMAAVSELTIETRHADEDTGIAVAVSGSSEVAAREISRNPGTTVTVKNIFLNNPVRRKFMGSGKSEAARVLNMVSRLALAHPGVGFKVVEKGRELLSFAEGTLKHRTGEVVGFNITNDLLPVQWSDGVLHVQGFISTPQQARIRASHQYFYVNRRGIQSGLISRALLQSYEVLPPGRFPMAVLFLTMPSEAVDVNVHPTKKEVRFLEDSRVFWAVSQAVKTTLRKMVDAPVLDLSPAAPDAPASLPGDSVSRGDAIVGVDPVPAFAYDPGFRADASMDLDVPPPVGGNQIHLFPGVSRFDDPQSETPFSPGFSPPIPYLQLHNGFILFGVESGLTLVNQQAAHERILYEKSMEELRMPGRFSSQQLLFPEVLEFAPAESLFLEEHLGHLQALGFDLEAFGGNTFQLRGLPMEVKPDRGRKVIYEMVQDLLRPERSGGANGSEEFTQRIARAYAGATGIKLGEPLDYARMSALMDGLFATQNPYVSPGGAPIVVRFSLEEIQRKFGLK